MCLSYYSKLYRLLSVHVVYSFFVSPQESCRIAIQTEGMIKDLVRNLSSDNDELQMHCSSAIFKVSILQTCQ